MAPEEAGTGEWRRRIWEAHGGTGTMEEGGEEEETERQAVAGSRQEKEAWKASMSTRGRI